MPKLKMALGAKQRTPFTQSQALGGGLPSVGLEDKA